MRRFYKQFGCFLVRLMLVPRAEGSSVPVPGLVLRRINDHLDYCKRCKIELKGLRLTTFVLTRMALKSPRKSFDPHFADRVLDRVRRGELARKRRMAHVRIVCAGFSAALTLAISVFWMGGFNSLSANWLIYRHLHATSRRMDTAPAPYPDRDPFALPVGGKVSMDLSGESQPGPGAQIASNHPLSKNVPVPDLLSHLPTLTGQGDSSRIIINVGTDVVAVRQSAETPTYAESSYQQQDKRTLPGILSIASSSSTNSSGLAVIAPTPAPPATPSMSLAPAETSLPSNNASAPISGATLSGMPGIVSNNGTNGKQPTSSGVSASTTQLSNP